MFMPRRATVLTAVVAVLALSLTACSGDDDDADSSASTAKAGADTTGALEWRDCADDVECAGLVVPLDYDDPDGDTITLALERRRASGDRVGALLANPGGPGASGLPMVDNASSYFSDDILDRFDIVSWDPRGVGKSSPIECTDDLDFFFATVKSPDDAAEVEANVDVSQRLVNACEKQSKDLLPYLSSKSTVQDMDRIREALGEDKLSYIGFSYGTFLGALYADRYPDKVRALVLDGALDPALGFEQVTREQAMGFDSALNAFFDDCAKRGCGFGGDDPRSAYEKLAAQIDAETLPAEVGGEERDLGPGEFDLGVATALYAGKSGWEVLADGLRDAARGDGSLLLSLSDTYTSREPGGDYSNEFEAFLGIGCLDSPAPSTDELATMADGIAKDAPYFGAATAWLSAPCSLWPVPPVITPGPVTATGAPPIVVIGTSNDPATPLKWAVSLAGELESGHLITFEGEGHTAYAQGDDCVDNAVDDYLIDLEVPEDGLKC
jgi:pimeloyl-ACP methyl ester carboxylesterase